MENFISGSYHAEMVFIFIMQTTPIPLEDIVKLVIQGHVISSSTPNFADKEAAGAMKNMSDIYDYFKKEHNLKSYDNKDSKVVASVHGFDSTEVSDGVKEDDVNAFWHPPEPNGIW